MTTYDHNGVSVVAAVGDFDLSTLHLLRDGLAKALKASRRVVVDLRGAGYMDTSGLGALISALKNCRPDGWVRLVGPQPNVLRILQMTSLDTIFPIYETLHQAVSAER